MKIISMLHDHLKKNYIGWEYKKRRIGVDGDAIFKHAIQIESEYVTDDSDLDRAVSNLNFFDRLNRLIATFQDSHLRVRTLPTFPRVTSGCQVMTVRGRCFISGVHDRLSTVTYQAPGQRRRIAAGDELLQVDNEELDRAVRALVPFVSASSYASAWATAARCLTSRNFRYPLTPHARYRLRSAQDDKEYEVELPWRYLPQPERWDAETVLRKRDIQQHTSAVSIPFAYINPRAPALDGTDTTLHGAMTYFRTSTCTEPTFTTGVWKSKGGEYGVVRIREMLEDLFIESARRTFRGEFSAFLARLQRERMPLLLDARQNRGGNGELAMFVASFFFSPTNLQSPCSSTTLICERDLLESDLLQAVPASLRHDADALQMLITKVRNDMLDHRPGPLVARGPDLPISDERVFLFNQPTVMLISQDCGSAGDVLASLLKNSERVLLLGSNTEGAGFGFRRNGCSERPYFRDPLQTIHVDVPNQAWGRPQEGPRRCWDSYDDYWTHLIENVPVEPDLDYPPEEVGAAYTTEAWYRKAACALQNCN